MVVPLLLTLGLVAQLVASVAAGAPRRQEDAATPAEQPVALATLAAPAGDVQATSGRVLGAGTDGLSLWDGDEVWTGADGGAQVLLADGSVALLGAGTHVRASAVGVRTGLTQDQGTAVLWGAADLPAWAVWTPTAQVTLGPGTHALLIVRPLLPPAPIQDTSPPPDVLPATEPELDSEPAQDPFDQQVATFRPAADSVPADITLAVLLPNPDGAPAGQLTFTPSGMPATPRVLTTPGSTAALSGNNLAVGTVSNTTLDQVSGLLLGDWTSDTAQAAGQQADTLTRAAAGTVAPGALDPIESRPDGGETPLTALQIVPPLTASGTTITTSSPGTPLLAPPVPDPSTAASGGPRPPATSSGSASGPIASGAPQVGPALSSPGGNLGGGGAGSGGGGGGGASAPQPTATNPPPTQTPVPTRTSLPTATSEPVVSPPTSAPEPTATSTRLPTVTPQPSATPTVAPIPTTAPTAGESMALRFTAPTGSVSVGDTFQVAVMLVAGAQPVDGAELHVDFDPAVLRVVDASGNPAPSVTAGGQLDFELLNRADNTAGQINYAAGRLTDPFPNGTITIARMTFRALAPSAASGTSLTFASGGGRRQLATFAGAALPVAPANTSVVIVP